MPSTPRPEDPRSSLRPVPPSEVREQEEAYRDLLAELGTADDDEVQAALEDREESAPEEDATARLND